MCSSNSVNTFSPFLLFWLLGTVCFTATVSFHLLDLLFFFVLSKVVCHVLFDFFIFFVEEAWLSKGVFFANRVRTDDELGYILLGYHAYNLCRWGDVSLFHSCVCLFYNLFSVDDVNATRGNCNTTTLQIVNHIVCFFNLGANLMYVGGFGL